MLTNAVGRTITTSGVSNSASNRQINADVNHLGTITLAVQMTVNGQPLVPSGGAISANDTRGGDTLGIVFVNTVPEDGSDDTQVTGGATVNWEPDP